ncbi:MAG: PLP-dependent cysteine synthase family protein, partial [Ardenticatenaceae bacterium]
LDSTSGNTGIAYAWIGAAKGYRVALVMPENVSEERKRMLHAYGAEMILTDPLEGADGAIRYARELVAGAAERFYYANQYDNDANWQAHYLSTGPEIWAQTEGRVTHFVAGVGTGGTMMGVGRFLRRMNPGVHLVGVQPSDELNAIEGLKHTATAIVPAIYQDDLLEETRFVEPDDAYAMTKSLSIYEGWLVGFSAGAAIHSALRLARELEEGVIVTILPDGGAKYLSLMG